MMLYVPGFLDCSLVQEINLIYFPGTRNHVDFLSRDTDCSDKKLREFKEVTVIFFAS